jgi:hypothetical protein
VYFIDAGQKASQLRDDLVQIDTLNGLLRQMRAERDALAREYAERDALARERAEHNALARERSERDALARERAARDELARERTERGALAREVAEQAAQLALLQDQLLAANAANHEGTQLENMLRRRVQDQEDEAQRTREELRRARNDLNVMRIERADIEIPIHTLEAEVANLNLQNARLRYDNRRLAAEMAKMEGHEGRRWGRPSSEFRLLPVSFDPELRSVSANIGETYRQFDEEVQRLCEQREERMKNTRRTVECGICMERHHGDRVAALDPCGHEFCRNCIKSHVGVQLAERRFPILCPICKAEGIKDEPGSA